METLSERRETLCLSFALKAANNPKTKHMFPLNEKKHEMMTRQPEKYLVQHTTTSRLEKSAIIYMQNLLNNYENR